MNLKRHNELWRLVQSLQCGDRNHLQQHTLLFSLYINAMSFIFSFAHCTSNQFTLISIQLG